MSLSNLFKKASEIFTGGSSQDLQQEPAYQDGETIFCKNNVCVHPASILREDYDVVHHPGYLTIHYTSCKPLPGLHLVWVPNTSLHKTPGLPQSRRSQSLNRYDNADTPCASPQRRRPRCLTHASHDSLESQCSGCSPSFDSESLTSVDSGNETVIFDSTVKNNSSALEHDGILAENDDILVVESLESDTLEDGNEVSKVLVNGEPLDTKSSDGEIKPAITVCANVESDSKTIDGFNPNINSQTDSNSNSESSCSKDVSSQENSVALSSSQKHFTDSSKVKETDQPPHQKEIHQKVNEPVFRNSDTTGTSCKTNVNHISRPKKTNCQTQDTGDEFQAQATAFEPNCEISNVEKVTKQTLENNKTPLETHSDSFDKSFELKYSEEIGIPKSNQGSVNPTSSSDRNPDSPNETFLNNSGNSVLPSLEIHQIDNCTDHSKHMDNINSSNENNCKGKDHLVKTVNDDSEEVEVFNIETIRQIPNGTKNPNGGKTVLNGIKTRISVQKPPLWSGLEPRYNLNSTDAASHNQSLPCSPFLSRSKKSCRKFSIDLNEMKSLRLFFCDAAKTKGQFVIASRESQYKILHFHHGGLNKLAKLLNEWNFVKSQNNQYGEVLPYSHFMVYQPSVADSELHPEETTFADHIDILSFFNPAGQIEDELAFRRYIFFNGVPARHRALVWPFLLNYYGYNTTHEEREWIVNSKRQEYLAIEEKRRRLTGQEREEFVRTVDSVVEKDVIRTDRGNPFYAGLGNPHVETMKRILLNYAVYDAGLGYTQGMSDLLAPVLAEIRIEPDVFWCFTGLLRRGLFVCTPTDSDMEQNLNYFRELMRIMDPRFYEHLTKHVDAMELLFCHRWILLCFKREFQTESALSIWESCWSSYATEYFHLFVCLAIVSIYGNDVVAQNMRTDEMLLHFSSLANYMDAKLILRKARGLVHNFRQLSVIPCTLVRLCRQCAPGIWDSAPVPTVVCENSHCECEYRNTE